jgi:hypothetical protein
MEGRRGEFAGLTVNSRKRERSSSGLISKA